MTKAPAEQQAPINALVEELNIGALPESLEAEELANEYIGAPLRKGPRGDRRHLAYATVFECDTVVSWNMHDIVNSATYDGTREVNMAKGRRTITVETPAMLMGEERPEWLPPATP